MKTIFLKDSSSAIVDDDDFESLSRFKWRVTKRANKDYACTNLAGKTRSVYMHSMLCPTAEGQEVDHVNGNGLDNRRSNLRPCTKQQNQWNKRKAPTVRGKKTSSRFKGVSWNRRDKRWHAQICHNNKQMFIGCFRSEEEAARAYDRRASELFGPFARLNLQTQEQSA